MIGRSGMGLAAIAAAGQGGRARRRYSCAAVTARGGIVGPMRSNFDLVVHGGTLCRPRWIRRSRSWRAPREDRRGRHGFRLGRRAGAGCVRLACLARLHRFPCPFPHARRTVEGDVRDRIRCRVARGHLHSLRHAEHGSAADGGGRVGGALPPGGREQSRGLRVLGGCRAEQSGLASIRGGGKVAWQASSCSWAPLPAIC